MGFIGKVLTFLTYSSLTFAFKVPLDCSDATFLETKERKVTEIICKLHEGPIDRDVKRQYSKILNRIYENQTENYLNELKIKAVKELLDKKLESLKTYPELCSVYSEDSRYKHKNIYTPQDVIKDNHPYAPCFSEDDSKMNDVYKQHYAAKTNFCNSSSKKKDLEKEKRSYKKIQVLMNLVRLKYLENIRKRKTLGLKKQLEIIEDSFERRVSNSSFERQYNGASACIDNNVFTALKELIDKKQVITSSDFKKCPVFLRENSALVDSLISTSKAIEDNEFVLNTIRTKSPLLYSAGKKNSFTGSLEEVKTPLAKQAEKFLATPRGEIFLSDMYQQIQSGVTDPSLFNKHKKFFEEFKEDENLSQKYKAQVFDSVISMGKQMSGICESNGKYLPLHPEYVDSYFSQNGEYTSNEFLKDETSLQNIQCQALFDAQDSLNSNTSLILGGAALVGGALLAIPSGGSSLIAAFSITAGMGLTGLGIKETIDLGENSATTDAMYNLNYTSLDEVIKAKEEYNLGLRLSAADVALGIFDIGALVKIIKKAPPMNSQPPSGIFSKEVLELDDLYASYQEKMFKKISKYEKVARKQLKRHGPPPGHKEYEKSKLALLNQLVRNDPDIQKESEEFLKSLTIKYIDSGMPAYITKSEQGNHILEFDVKNFSGNSKMVKLIRRYQRLYPEYDLSQMLRYDPLDGLLKGYLGVFDTSGFLDIGFYPIISNSENILDTNMMHELRHASFNIQRERGNQSIFDVRYTSNEGLLQPNDLYGYTHDMSAEEVYNNIKMLKDSRRNIQIHLSNDDLARALAETDETLDIVKVIRQLSNSAIKHSKSVDEQLDQVLKKVSHAIDNDLPAKKLFVDLKSEFGFEVTKLKKGATIFNIQNKDGIQISSQIVDNKLLQMVEKPENFNSLQVKQAFKDAISSFKQQNQELVEKLESKDKQVEILEKALDDKKDYYKRDSNNNMSISDKLLELINDVTNDKRKKKSLDNTIPPTIK